MKPHDTPKRWSRFQACTVVSILAVSAFLSGCATTSSGARSARSNSDAYAYYLLGQQYTFHGNLEGAVDAFKNAVRADPENGELHLRYAEAMVPFSDATEVALEQVRIAHTLGVRQSETTIVLARIYETAGEVDTAFEKLRSAAIADPTPSLFVNWFSIAGRAGRNDEQLAAGKAYVAALPSDVTAWRALGQASRNVSDFAAAGLAYASAARVPGGGAPWDFLQSIESFKEAGDGAAALRTADECIRRFQDGVECLTERVLLLDAARVAGEPVDAVTNDAIGQLAAQTSGNSRSLYYVSDQLSGGVDAEVAKQFAHALVRLRPYNTSLLIYSSYLLERVGLTTEAISFMQRVLEIDRSNFTALNHIGYTWADRGENLEQAEVYIREAVFLRPDDMNILDSLAWVLYRQGRYEEALEVQLRVVAEPTELGLLYDHLGDIYEALGRCEEARTNWQLALERFSDREDKERTATENKLRATCPS